MLKFDSTKLDLYHKNFSSNFVRLSNNLKDIQTSKNQADTSFATEIRNENLDNIMKKMYNETFWTINQNQGYALANEGEC